MPRASVLMAIRVVATGLGFSAGRLMGDTYVMATVSDSVCFSITAAIVGLALTCQLSCPVVK